jgi:hypothetical protein
MRVIMAVAEAIREAGTIPSGTLYAALSGRVGLPGFESIIRTLENGGLVRKSGDQLTWIGGAP